MTVGATASWRTPREGPAPPDQAARDRIVEDLDTSLLVEAGAGSGKTTALLERMVALLATGRARAPEIAAVTFTKKAAAELRERFQIALEDGFRRAREAGDEEVAARLDAALQDIERAFIGTIHAFCGRLLRERPIAARLDPGFRELTGPEEEEHRRRFWHKWVEQRGVAEDPALPALEALGISPYDLYAAFTTLDANRDVEFPAPEVGRPDAAPVRRALEALLDRTAGFLPRREPEKGWDVLQKKLRRLRYARSTPDWDDDAAFFDELSSIVGYSGYATWFNRWPEVDPDRVREVRDAVVEFGANDGLAERTLSRWYAHRYPVVLGFAGRAAADYAAERLRTGRLTFQDLLLHAARLLRESPSARRELGARWPRLLVDEFQDTDPIQAEVVFLLAADDPGETDWRRVVPRPGALFVVGDPKQSIYRFRRADIEVYQQARRRFDGVLELIANFRSRPAIGEFVDTEFSGRFPEAATEVQAAFAPLATQRPRSDGGEAAMDEGVWCYEVHPENPNRDANVAAADAERLAAWIDARIRSGARRPGDFLILPYHRKFLTRYAEALEARNVPVQVTGSELVIEDELSELRLLLEALVDPTDETLAVAVLIGLFFGLDHESLAAHALDGGSFEIAGARGPDGPVADAMDRLRGWHDLARRVPADVLVETLVGDLGLVPYAAASGLGAARAGAIGYVLQVIRDIGLEGDTSLRAAIEALDVTLEQGEAEAPLEPGREDVVRIMNLHRAKGTEAPVVVLAAPCGWEEYDPRLRVARHADGRAVGWTEVKAPSRGFHPPVVARPLDWRAHQAVEAEFEKAERDRLLYVAATRAEDELLVGRCFKSKGGAKDKGSFWEPLYGGLERCGPVHPLGEVPAPGRRPLETDDAAIVAACDAARGARAAAAEPSYQAVAATALAKGDDPALSRGAGGRGRDWGSAVHQGLEAALRGLDGDTLRLACRAALLAHERPVDRNGEPRELGELLALVEAIAGSELFARARSAERLLVEVPFARAIPTDAGPLQLVEGVVDLAFREPGGWVLVDWKTDEVDDPAILAARRAAYERQLAIYAECWEALTGEPVAERILRFTA